MNNNYEDMILHVADYILEQQCTIRATAQHFNIPKSTIHHMLSHKLKHINFNIYKQVKKLLENNFNIKHIHGGESTKLKYLKLKKEISKNEEYLSLNL